MDALPIEEQNDVPYRSANPGIMHACGHDVHMTCAMGAAIALSAIKEQLPGRVRIVYQHAEESSPSGAPDMVDFGALDDVCGIVALHCDPERPTGTIGIREGALTAAFDRFIFTLKGKSGHGARPHDCVDPIFASTQLAQMLYTFTSRNFDAREAMVLSLGTFHAGEVPNAIPDQATMSGTVRTISNARRLQVEPMLRQCAQSVCMLAGTTYELDLYQGAPAIINHPGVVNMIKDVAVGVLGRDHVQDIALPSMGSEDFSQYTQRIPGAMFRLGTAIEGRTLYKLHSSNFNVDEHAIELGATILAKTALRMLEAKVKDSTFLNDSNA
jgi:amidohydrolase